MFAHLLQIMHRITGEAYRPNHCIFSPRSLFVCHFKCGNKKLLGKWRSRWWFSLFILYYVELLTTCCRRNADVLQKQGKGCCPILLPAPPALFFPTHAGRCWAWEQGGVRSLTWRGAGHLRRTGHGTGRGAVVAVKDFFTSCFCISTMFRGRFSRSSPHVTAFSLSWVGQCWCNSTGLRRRSGKWRKNLHNWKWVPFSPALLV